MNTSVHIPKVISDRLDTYLKYHKTSKNKVIVDAINKFLTEQEDVDAWNPDIHNWQGVPELEFELETDRDFLLPSREQIF